MPQQFSLAQGSILIDVPTNYCAAYSKLGPGQRDLVGMFFRTALSGGDDPANQELFGDLHQSALRQIVPVDDDNQADIPGLAATANAVLAAYNARAEEFNLVFTPIEVEDSPDCYRWVYDPELDEWVLIINYGLSVSSGDASGDGFNWLPIADAQQQPNFALPGELDFLLDGKEVVVDLRYHLTLTFLAR